MTDVLETVFVLKGAERVIGSLFDTATALDKTSAAAVALTAAEESLAGAKLALLAPLTGMITQTTQLAAVVVNNIAGFAGMAAAEGIATAATVTLESVLLLLESPLVLIAGALALLTANLAIALKGLSEFSKSEDSIGRLAIQMKNLGNVFPTKELVAFAGNLSHLTGIDDELIASLGAAAAQFGLTRAQIEKTIPVVLDIAVANKKAPEEVLNTILRTAATGQTRGLTLLHINPNQIKGELKDINNLINQLGQGFGGTAEAFRNTLPGTVDALHTAVGNLFKAIGRFISPIAVPLLNLFISGIEKATALLEAIANFLHLPTAADLGKGKANELALKGDPEQTEALRGIERNTAQLDPLVKEVLGGKGIIARRAFNLRDARMAFGV